MWVFSQSDVGQKAQSTFAQQVRPSPNSSLDKIKRHRQARACYRQFIDNPMKIKTLITILLISGNIFGQNKDVFNIKTAYKTKAEISTFIKSLDSLNKKYEFFEDEKYIVYPFCRGEWGGAIIFKNKLTKTKYICESTCPVAVTKFNNKYIITNTLNHLVGSTEVLEIVNPEKLNKATEEDEKRFTYEKVAQTGAKKLIDLYRYTTLYTFVYENKLYHIIAEENETYIAEILDGKFVKLQMISDKNLWTYTPKILKKEDSVIVTFNDYKNAGYIEIQGNSIDLYLVK